MRENRGWLLDQEGILQIVLEAGSTQGSKHSPLLFGAREAVSPCRQFCPWHPCPVTRMKCWFCMKQSRLLGAGEKPPVFFDQHSENIKQCCLPRPNKTTKTPCPPTARHPVYWCVSGLILCSLVKKAWRISSFFLFYCQLSLCCKSPTFVVLCHFPLPALLGWSWSYLVMF